MNKNNMKPFDDIKKRLDICDRCNNLNCKKSIFNISPPIDCPYNLEKIIIEQDEDLME